MTDHPQSELPNIPEKPQPELFRKGQDTNNDSPVTCLGMVFKSETERWEYFTGLLQEKLKDPEFRAIEGFPIGEDEDILALSDPPYYTACPNPWIDDFIAQWEKEKPEKPEGWTYHREPFAVNVSEGKYHPFYRAHSYHAKTPHRAIMRYLLHYTQPGDIVLDSFSGTGMTGVAAQLCSDKVEIEKLGYKINPMGGILRKINNKNGNSTWSDFSQIGSRRILLNDISSSATFIAHNYNTPINEKRFRKQARNILKQLQKEWGWMYDTHHIDGSIGKINYIVWSDVFICPNCSEELVFWDEAVDKENESIKKNFLCPSCRTELTKRNLDNAYVTHFDEYIKEQHQIIKQKPMLINYSIQNKRFDKTPDEFDLDLIKKIEEIKIPFWVPVERLIPGKETRRNDSSGITHFHHFFYKRALIILAGFSEKIRQIDPRGLWITTAVTEGSSKLNRERPGGLPSKLSGTLYISSLIREINIIDFMRRKTKKYLSAGDNENSIISCQSSTKLIGNSQVDYIFLDPPFGSNLFYSELNFLWECWLKVLTNNRLEAIENSAQGKSLDDYRILLKACFKEAYRLLKPGRWLTVEFSNTKASVWNSIQSAITDVGFIIANVSALDKKQGSFKAVTTTTAVKQDLIISAYKPNGGFTERFEQEAESEKGVWDFIRTHLGYLPVTKTSDSVLQHIPERDPRILYDQVVSYYVRNGFMVPLSSQEFQAGLRQRFAERDGMIFLPDQVAEYDKAKLRLGNELQYSLFVSDESSAIDWLRRFLKEKPQTYQEIQPHFMQEAQRAWKKNEKPIELQALLEQNFLQYDGEGLVPPQIHSYLSSNWKEYRNLGKDDPELKAKAKDRWYVPDPNQTADIEKLRERALLREFETYIEGNKRLKLFRLEALRAGFKKAYAENDYETILKIADRLPHNVLEEDPKLLMWYDLAKTRMEG